MSNGCHEPLRRSGHTFVELMIAMAGASLLMVGLASAILISVSAAKPGGESTSTLIKANSLLTEIRLNLEFAESLTQKSATAIAFTVPDRDGDASAETFRYAWSGTPGDPLTREYNGGDAVALIDNVYSLDIQYFHPASAEEYVALQIQPESNPLTSLRTGISLVNLP